MGDFAGAMNVALLTAFSLGLAVDAFLHESLGNLVVHLRGLDNILHHAVCKRVHHFALHVSLFRRILKLICRLTLLLEGHSDQFFPVVRAHSREEVVRDLVDVVLANVHIGKMEVRLLVNHLLHTITNFVKHALRFPLDKVVLELCVQVELEGTQLFHHLDLTTDRYSRLWLIILADT